MRRIDPVALTLASPRCSRPAGFRHWAIRYRHPSAPASKGPSGNRVCRAGRCKRYRNAALRRGRGARRGAARRVLPLWGGGRRWSTPPCSTRADASACARWGQTLPRTRRGPPRRTGQWEAIPAVSLHVAHGTAERRLGGAGSTLTAGLAAPRDTPWVVRRRGLAHRTPGHDVVDLSGVDRLI